MKISVSTRDDIRIVSVSGNVGFATAGRLQDALVSAIAAGYRKLIVDTSGVGDVTPAGMRGLVVAAKLLRSTGGALRISGAFPAVEAFLRHRGYDHLLRFDPNVNDAIKTLSATSAESVPRPTEMPRTSAVHWRFERVRKIGTRQWVRHGLPTTQHQTGQSDDV